jgi:hypothetical protein
MNETTSLDTTKRQTINPLIDEINKVSEPLLKKAMKEFGYEIPLAFRLYNQIRFYEEYGKLNLGVSVASKEQLAEQFGVTIKQIDDAFNNLTNKYKLGKWVDHNEPVFRNVKRTWVSNSRYEKGFGKYYGVIPEVLQRNSTGITAYQLAPEVRPLSEYKKNISEYNNLSKDKLAKAYGNSDINSYFDYWEKATGYKITSKIKQNRQACSNLIRKAGDELHQLIDGVALSQNDKFAPSVADFVDLQAKINQLLVWGKKQSMPTGAGGGYCKRHTDNFVPTGKSCGYC